jgi:tetratricopeptide (TPR) repeat protein
MLDVIFEQRVYLPGAFLVPGLIAPIFMLRGPVADLPALRLALLVSVAIFAWQTIQRNEQWAQPSRLWAADLAGAKTGRAAANASIAALANRQSDTVLRVHKRAAAGHDENDPPLGQKLNTARAHMVRQDFARAVELTRAVVTEAPRFRRAAYLHAINLIQLDRLEAARAIIRRFVARDPEHLWTIQLLAYLDVATGQAGTAAHRLRRWLDEHPDQPLPKRLLARNQLAMSVEQSGNPAEAARIYRSIIRVHPQNWTAWIQLAKLYRAGGSTDEARTIEAYLRARGVNVAGADGDTAPAKDTP